MTLVRSLVADCRVPGLAIVVVKDGTDPDGTVGELRVVDGGSYRRVR